MFQFDGMYGLPGIQAALGTVENQFWWDRFENQVWMPKVIVGTSRDTGNTSYTDVLRAGLLLGEVTATGKLKEWNPTGTDGSQYLFGILGYAQKMQRLSADFDRWVGWVMVAGYAKANRLLVPGQSAFGISGNANEHLIRGQCFPRIILSDRPWGHSMGGWRAVLAKTADYTVTEADNGTFFTTRGAGGAVIFTLPATAEVGLHYGFYNAAGQNMKVTSGTADTTVSFNDLTADSVSLETSGELIGGSFEVLGDGTGWLVIPHVFGLGATAQTVTTAT